MSHDERHLSPQQDRPASASRTEYGLALPALSSSPHLSQPPASEREGDALTSSPPSSSASSSFSPSSSSASSSDPSSPSPPAGSADAVASTQMQPMQPPNQLTTLERWTADASDWHLDAMSGAVGGFMSGIVTCPLDVIKTKLQAQGGFAAMHKDHNMGHHRVYEGLVGTARVIWKEEGIRGMYRGLGPIILGYLPTWAVWFTVYNKSKRWMAQYSKNTFVINFWSSIIAGASSTLATNPIWVIKTRLMSQTAHRPTRPTFSHYPKSVNASALRSDHAPWHYRSTWDAARKMYKTEGIMAFYSGLTPALLGLTHVAVQFPAYEFLKVKFTGRPMGAEPGHHGAKERSSWIGILSASILSKILASSATYPHEVIRTRLQTQRRPSPGHEYIQGLGASAPPDQQLRRSPSSPKYRGIVMTFRTILREEGWRAFYAGMGTNMMRAVPAATVTMCTYEFVMSRLREARTNGLQKRALENERFEFSG